MATDLIQRARRVVAAHASKRLLMLRGRFGTAARWCPACGRAVAGFFVGRRGTPWGCPACGSSPRERLVNLLIDDGTLTVPEDGAVLHLAPGERSLVRRFGAAGEYVPADLSPEKYPAVTAQRLDLMVLDDVDRYDLVYASHVMEHVPDDRLVLANLARAIRPGGEAWLLVPRWRKPTEDGGPDLSAEERTRRFGQWDHLRMYGPDFTDRLVDAGFVVDEFDAGDLDPAVRDRSEVADRVFRARVPG